MRRASADHGGRCAGPRGGGNAVDACVAAAFASWVAESPLTGPGAGGFALVHSADGRPERLADFFVATPGRGSRRRPRNAEMEEIDVEFGGDAPATQVFRIGEPSCAVPGAAAGLEALHRAYGLLPWPELLAPAVELARGGVEMTRPQAHLHAILDLILRHTTRVAGSTAAPRGHGSSPVTFFDCPTSATRSSGSPGTAPLRSTAASSARRSCAPWATAAAKLTRDDLAAYRVIWRRPAPREATAGTRSSRIRRRRPAAF